MSPGYGSSWRATLRQSLGLLGPACIRCEKQVTQAILARHLHFSLNDEILPFGQRVKF